MIYEFRLRTDPGRVRTHNEDPSAPTDRPAWRSWPTAWAAITPAKSPAAWRLLHKRAAAVAVAGRAAGNAEGAALEHSAKANRSIFKAASSQPQYSAWAPRWWWAFPTTGCGGAHRRFALYRLRGEFEQVTRDHSLLQEQIDSGMITPEQAATSQNKNLVTRALGIDPRCSWRSTSTVEPGDIYLLCSDGLSDMVGDEAIAPILLESELSWIRWPDF